jgi:hypothetical protein
MAVISSVAGGVRRARPQVYDDLIILNRSGFADAYPMRLRWRYVRLRTFEPIDFLARQHWQRRRTQRKLFLHDQRAA